MAGFSMIRARATKQLQILLSFALAVPIFGNAQDWAMYTAEGTKLPKSEWKKISGTLPNPEPIDKNSPLEGFKIKLKKDYAYVQAHVTTRGDCGCIVARTSGEYGNRKIVQVYFAPVECPYPIENWTACKLDTFIEIRY